MKTRTSRLMLLAGCSAVFFGGVWLQPAASQAPEQETHEQRAARFRQMSVEAESTRPGDAFQGDHSDGAVEPGFFPVRSTGVSTDRRAQGGRRVPGIAHQGAARQDDVRRGRLGVAEVDEPGLLRPAGRQLSGDDRRRSAKQPSAAARALSAKGLKQTRDIMRLNHTLGELNDNNFDAMASGAITSR